jgi:hypothetical protein
MTIINQLEEELLVRERERSQEVGPTKLRAHNYIFISMGHTLYIHQCVPTKI